MVKSKTQELNNALQGGQCVQPLPQSGNFSSFSGKQALFTQDACVWNTLSTPNSTLWPHAAVSQ